jgi:mono/diheme cytochrome c family protein
VRHLLANLITYSIAISLFIGAALFARMRSSQYTLTYQQSVLAMYEPTPGHEFEWRELGPQTYRRNCRACHASDGTGWDRYPPVVLAATWLDDEDERAFLIDLLLYGLSRRGMPVPMPPMGHMHDVEIAAVLNYIVTAFGGATTGLFTPDEIAARRGQDYRPQDLGRRYPY